MCIKKILILLAFIIMILPFKSLAQLSPRQDAIARIASLTATGSLDSLTTTLNEVLNETLTVNETKEVMVHSYAYCGFPRALQGLKTLVKVLDDRKQKGITENWGLEATPLDNKRDKYENGRRILSEISGVPAADTPKADYAVLAPEIEVFLKEHLFSDLFERDVLNYEDREVATVAVIASLGKGVEPMLASHSKIAMRLGVTPEQIAEIIAISNGNRFDNNLIFPKGDEIKTKTFEGRAWLNRLMTDSDNFDVVVSDVVFEKGAHNDWHKHPGGQILIATFGKGFYQERGKAIQVLYPGDIVTIRPNVEHWHGAADDSGFTHIAINTNVHLGPTEWLEKVNSTDYNNRKESKIE